MERDWSLIPEHMRPGVKLYLDEGVKPGHFLTAVICNDLCQSFALADHINKERLFDIVKFFYNCTPLPCWGSPEKMKAWMAMFDDEGG